jgi:cell division control protein 11
LSHSIPFPYSPPGASGTGRTTFVNTLVEQSLLPHRVQSLLVDPEDPHSALDMSLVQEAARHAHEEEPVRIKPVNVELEEDGVRIALTIVDTPGFGDGIDNEAS